MTYRLKFALSLAVGLALAGGLSAAEPRGEPDHKDAKPAASMRPAAPRGEDHAGPGGYKRVAEPQGWNGRPAVADRGAYQHNYQAARSFKIGPYHRPAGWTTSHWAFGQTLPRAYWGPEYLLADYWLFALEVPPTGYEWVRDDDDAILVNTGNGEILQVEYGDFS